jgi:hypothetical protein
MSSLSRTLTLLVLTALSLVTASIVRADTTARIVETQPADRATLGRQESLWIHIEYDTSEAVSLWARPYRNGAQLKKIMSNASPKYTGSGEALGWFALMEPGAVDEVRIVAGGGRPYREWELARQPVDLHWTDAAASSEPRPQWVTDLLAADQARQREDSQRRANEPVPAGETAFFGGFMLLILALFVASIGVPVWSVWKWRGGWRIAAALPAGVVLFVVLRIVVDTTRDPTSHNLWPFEILEFGIVALAIVAALKLLRRFIGVQA